MKLLETDIALISDLASRIKQLLGLNFPENRLAELARGLSEAARELGIDSSLPAILQWLHREQLTESELKVISTHLTINETYFFRESMALDLLVEKIVPEILAQKHRITIWCAGCSSGEEPYSIAMILNEHFSATECAKIKILATDISERVLNKARSGIYTSWSFRDTPDSIRSKYFDPIAKLWELKPSVRNMVQFGYLNLVEESYKINGEPVQHIDVVFCRNVLIYFDKETINSITRKFYQCLTPEGWLIPSQTELNEAYFPDFRKYYFGRNIFYHKKSDGHLNGSVANPSGTEQVKLPEPKVIKQKAATPVQPEKQLPQLSRKEDVTGVNHLEKLYKSGRYAELIELINHPTNLPDIDSEMLSLGLKCHIQLGKNNELVEWAEMNMKKYSVNASFLYLYGTCLVEIGYSEKAETIFKKSIYLDKNYVLSYISLGHLANEHENKSRALKWFGNAISLIDSGVNIEFTHELLGMTRADLRNMVIRFIELLA